MGLFEDVVLKHSIEIRTTPDKIWEFLANLETNYRTWHPDDHVAFRWEKGEPWAEGSIVYAEEYLHGKLHKLKFRITRVVPKSRIEFSPAFWLWRIYFPKNTSSIEPRRDTCIFTATGHMRVGWLVKTLARKPLDKGIASANKHMKEEGENLKKILESEK